MIDKDATSNTTDETKPDDTQPVNDRVIPSAVGDIHMPGGSSKIPFDMDINFSPNVPVQFGPSAPDQGYGQSTTETGIQPPQAGVIKSGLAEAYDWSVTPKLIHGMYEKFQQPNPLDDPHSPDWKPTDQPDMFQDIDPKYTPNLMDARGPKELAYIHNQILGEQQHDETLANGSTFGKIVGGLVGAFADPIGWIPIVGWAKYAKFGSAVVKGAMHAFPGIAKYSVLQSAATQLDKVNGNLSDFVLDAGINTVVGTSLFGVAGAGALLLDKMELFHMNDLLSASSKGIQALLKTDDKGKLTGFQAVDTTGGSVGAAEVMNAQKLLDSSFNKSGIFKIPYVGAGIMKLAGAPVIGSPLARMVDSQYSVERAFVDRAVDHGYLTKGVAEGGTQGVTFDHLMKQEHADLRSIAAQMTSLHMQRMGVNVKFRPAQDLVKLGTHISNTTIKTLGMDADKYGTVTRDKFDDEVQQVLHSGNSSDHAAVNEAAAIARKKMDDTWKANLESRGRSTTIAPPKYAEQYLTRVYDTHYMNANKESKWVPVMSNYLKESDKMISDKMEPIHSLESQVKSSTDDHEQLIKRPNVSDNEIKSSSDNLEKMKRDLKFQKENLQNELRTNPDMIYHVDDMHAMSADEAKESIALQKPLNDLKQKSEEQKKVVSDLKNQKAKSKQSSMKGKTAETAKKHADEVKTLDNKISSEEEKLTDINNQVEQEKFDLYSKARNGEINPNLYYPETYEFKDPNNRLKFRDTFNSPNEEENKMGREGLARAWFDSIMHMNPEDIIADIMGKLKGSHSENPLKQRTLMAPDKLLYDNNFMTKNLMAKLNNYVLYLSRRTNLKKVFSDVTPDGSIEPLIEKLRQQHLSNRAPLDNKKLEIENSLKQENLSPEDKKSLEKESAQTDKKINNETIKFNESKKRMNMTYERMMGLRKRERWEVISYGVIRSLVAAFNLHMLPATQIADIGSMGLQVGMIPFIRDSVYPVLTSLNGLLKTKDSEALREVLPHVNLGLNDVLNGHADKNISMETQPYLNMGRTLSAVENFAHYSSNLDLSTYMDNNLQKWAGSAWQGAFMTALVKHAQGNISTSESELLRRYGIDPEVWSDRMVKAYKDAGGRKTLLGSHMSMFWKWQDIEASNKFSSAVFRGIQNTIINRGLLDSPFWHENIIGMIFQTFAGWGYASINRYVLPTLQRPDADKFLGVLVSLMFGSLVSPTRRLIRGDPAYPDSMDEKHRAWEIMADANVSSALASTLSYANMMTGDRIIGDLKNDKYRDRVRVGTGSAVFGSSNRLAEIFSALATGEFNKQDAYQASQLLSITGSIYGSRMSKALIDSTSLPTNRSAAHAEKQ